MENTNSNQFTNDIAPLPERPQFLKVLCILTWIACGFMFISGILGMVSQSPEKQAAQIEKLRETNPDMADKLETVVSSQDGGMRTVNSILGLVSVVLSAYGAALMWQLKKTGFYLYIAGELLPYIGFIMGGAQAMAAVGAMAGTMGAAIGGIVMGVMVIFDIAFIVMYGVNLKYMKR